MTPGAGSPQATASTDSQLVKGLGLLDATMLVVGSMIGSGIFIVSAEIGRMVGSPGLLLVVWIVTVILTLIGALSYGELAAAMPRAGGQYVYLRESLGTLCGFLYGWAMLLVIQTATIAAVAIAFAKFTGVLFPWFSSSNWISPALTLGPYELAGGVKFGPYNLGLNTQNLLAVVSILFLTWLNTRGLRTGALVQNVFTIAKTAALCGLILLGLIFSTPAAIELNFSDFWGKGFWGDAPFTAGTIGIIAVAMVGSLFSSDSWNNVTFTGAEVKDPVRTLPRALGLGVALVGLLYLLANVAYLRLLPFPAIQHAAEGRVGTAAAAVVLGANGAAAMAAAIMVSTFGCNNGLILAGARIFYAMARDGLFFAGAGRLNGARAPGAALWIQASWASCLCLSGTYDQLLDFVIFTVLLFYILTMVGLFVLRIRRPDLPRPYRAPGFPVVQILYIAAAGFIEIQLLRHKPDYTWPGLILVVLGIPVYWIWRAAGPRPAT